jgi:hypothetical protein
MSRTRAPSSRGIADFPKDGLANIILQPTDRHHVYLATEFLLKQALDPGDVEEIAIVREIDEEVDVGIRAIGTARNRAEDTDSPNMPAPELGLQPRQGTEDSVKRAHDREV